MKKMLPKIFIFSGILILILFASGVALADDPPNKPPITSAPDDQDIPQGVPIVFWWKMPTDYTGSIISYKLEIGSKIKIVFSGGPTTESYSLNSAMLKAGSYSWCLRACSDNAGKTCSSCSTSKTIRIIGNNTGQIKCSILAPTKADVNQSIQCSTVGEVVAPWDADLKSVKLDFGDGTPESHPCTDSERTTCSLLMVNHAYKTAKDYKITCQVTDQNNKTATAEQTISVSGAAVPPVPPVGTCTYDNGGCKDATKWCYNSSCTDCSTGYQNCDDKQGCECNVAKGDFCDAFSKCIKVKSSPSSPSSPEVTCPTGATCIDNPLGTSDLAQLIDTITSFIFKIGLAIAPILLIVAGFFFVTSVGDPNRVQTAKRIILYTLIGLAILLVASGLIKVLQSILGVETS